MLMDTAHVNRDTTGRLSAAEAVTHHPYHLLSHAFGVVSFFFPSMMISRCLTAVLLSWNAAWIFLPSVAIFTPGTLHAEMQCAPTGHTGTEYSTYVSMNAELASHSFN